MVPRAIFLLGAALVAMAMGCAVGDDSIYGLMDAGRHVVRPMPDAGTDGPALDGTSATDTEDIDGASDDDALPTDGTVDVPVSTMDAANDLGMTGSCTTSMGRVCTPGDSQSCGNCGTQSCQGDCTWGACIGSMGCSPGATHTEACGNCGMQTYTCSLTCVDQPTGDCSGSGECSPGMTRTDDCGDCGHQVYTCSSSCSYEATGGCTGTGVCSPGSTQPGGCDPCSYEVCTGSCTWGGCTLRPGNACDWDSGTHHRACSACACGLQFCLESCQWSTACTSCCSTCGGCQPP